MKSTLTLLIDSLREAGAEAPVVHELCAGSWLVHVRRWCQLDERAFAELWSTCPEHAQLITMYGRRIEAPRRQRSFGVDYSFSGSVALAVPMSEEPLMQGLADIVERLQRDASSADSTTNASQLGALLNFYDSDKGHYIGPHSDDEAALVKGLPIYSFSFGQTRRFRLTPRNKGVGRTILLDLRHGDLVIMGGACQQTHKHELMKPTKLERAGGGRFGTLRMNATFRFFKGVQALSDQPEGRATKRSLSPAAVPRARPRPALRECE